MRTARWALLAAGLAALCACGGSGGGGGGGGGGGDFGDGGLVVTPRTLTFTSVAGWAPPSQTISASWTVGGATVFGAFLPPGASPPSWLPSGQPTSANWPTKTGTIQLTLNATGVGVHTIKILVGIGSGSPSNPTPIAYREVTVTYVVKSFGADTSAVASTAVFGSSVAPASRSVSLRAPSATPWTASSDRSWIRLNGADTASGATPSTVTIGFDPAGLATGTYTGTVTFVGAGQSDPVAVTLTVASPTLTVGPAPVQLAGLAGHDMSPKRVQVSLDTGTNAYPWTVSSTDGWVELAQLATTVAAAGTSFTVAPTAEAQGWSAGTTPGSVTVTASVNGAIVQQTVPITYRLDDLKLRLSDVGVALASTPGLSALSRTVQVATNRSTPVTFTATSDAGWLSAMPGMAGDTLELVADPTGLATDAVHEATVTVTSDDPDLAVTTETVRVGLWVGAFTPEPVTTVLYTVTRDLVEAAADPVRPYVYVHRGGPDLYVLNVHTGAVVKTLYDLATTLGSLAVASDGSRLFVSDTSNHRVIRVDPATWTLDTPVALTPGAGSLRLAYARPNGIPILLTTEGEIRDVTSGASYGTFTTPFFYGTTLAASRDGSRVCRLILGLSPSSQECWALDSTTSPSATSPIVVGPARSGSGGANGTDVALSPDGTRSYVASGGVYDFIVVDATAPGSGNLPTLGYLPGAPYPAAVDVGFDGRVHGGSAGTSLGNPSVWVYEADGTPVHDYAIANVKDRGLAASGDGLRLLVLTSGDPVIVTVPP